MVLPYLKGFLYFLCLVLWWMIWVIILSYIIRSIQVLNNWYQRTFLSQRREKMFGSFCIFFKRKKRGWRTSDSIMKLSTQNLQKIFGHLNSSRKNSQFQKTNTWIQNITIDPKISEYNHHTRSMKPYRKASNTIQWILLWKGSSPVHLPLRGGFLLLSYRSKHNISLHVSLHCLNPFI